jgi:hypothetical protein
VTTAPDETRSSAERRVLFGPPRPVPDLAGAAPGGKWQPVSAREGVTYYGWQPAGAGLRGDHHPSAERLRSPDGSPGVATALWLPSIGVRRAMRAATGAPTTPATEGQGRQV